MREPISEEIKAMRRSYGEEGLSESEAGSEPTALFERWLAAAAANPYIVEANAMVLGTYGGDQPTSRTVLLKGFDRERAGCIFFTNYSSTKARALDLNPVLSLLFPWYAMERQVIITARVEKVSRAESEEYFSSRPWSSQIGAWASNQSTEISGRDVLDQRWREIAARYPEGSTVPLPEDWGGFCAIAHSFEFWQGRYSRLHDRIRFTRDFDGNSAGAWSRVRLAP